MAMRPAILLAVTFLLGRASPAWAIGDCDGHPACCEEVCHDDCCLTSTLGQSPCPCGDGTCIDSCGSCNPFCMEGNPPPVSTGVCGTKSIDDAKIKEILTAAGQIAGPLIGGKDTVPINTHFSKVNWNFDVRLTEDDGLSVENIQLGGRTMAHRIRAPYFKVRLGGPPLSRCELKSGHVDACDKPLDPFWGKGKVRLIGFEVANGKAGASGQVPTLNVRASYEIDPATAPAAGAEVKACLYVTQDYAFSDADPAGCEPSNGLPCWRFYPTISFRYFAKAGDPEVIHMRMPQEMVFAPSGTTRGAQVFLSDGRANIPNFSNPIPFTTPQPFIGITDPYLGNPLPVEAHRVVVRAAQPVAEPTLAPWIGMYRSIDNMHQSCVQEVAGPGAFVFKISKVHCNFFLFRAGCPECVHMHWNWTAINSLTAAVSILCPKEPAQYNFGNPLVRTGSQQDIEIAEVVRRDDESDPEDYRALVNGESLLEADGAGAEKTFWYEGVATDSADSFNEHGGFFNPIGPDGGLFSVGIPQCPNDQQGPVEQQGLLPVGGLLLLLVAELSRRRARVLVLLLVLAGLLVPGMTACSQQTEGPKKGSSAPLPDTLYRGRGKVLTLHGAQAAIAPESVTVENLHATAPGEIQFTVRVAVDEPAEAAELSVDGKVVATLTIADALTQVGPPALLSQGWTAKLHVINHDEAFSDWDHGVQVAAGPDVPGGASGVSGASGVNGQDVELTLYALPAANPGSRDVLVSMGHHGVGAQARLRGALTVESLEVLPLQSGVDAPGAVPAGQLGATWALSGAAGKLVLLRVVAPLQGDNGPLGTVLQLQDPALGLLQPLQSTLGPELVAVAEAPGDPHVFVGLIDGPQAGDAQATVRADLFDPVLANEAEDNGVPGQAQVLIQPPLVTASLATADDVDWYRLEVPAGTLVVRTFPAQGGAQLDTEVQVLDANLAVLATNDDEAANIMGSLVIVPVQAGTVLIRVARGLDGYQQGGAYRLLALVR